MRQSVFTTHFLEFDRKVFSALWLRVALKAWSFDHKFLELKKRNARFRVEIYPADPRGPSADDEALYQIYRESLSFQPAPTLADLLVGSDSYSEIPTWQIDLFDADSRIASGYFDMGPTAAAGISSFYDPQYRKDSLGKYLIYLKMEFCKERGLRFFYPGYIAPGDLRFDYKRSMGAPVLEYLDLVSGIWLGLPVGSFLHPLSLMMERLESLQALLATKGFEPELYRNLHLDINLNPQIQGMGLFDYPVFLDCVPTVDQAPTLVVVFDPRIRQYHLFQCRSVYRFAGLHAEPGVFESDLLMVERNLFSTSEGQEMAACLQGFRLVTEG
jgi:arginine-tRNA-protein transferase